MRVMQEIERWRAQKQRESLAWRLMVWGMAGAFFGGAIVIVAWMRYV